jgi:pantoate--beta-alanine ligase
MKILKTIKEYEYFRKNSVSKGMCIGFVPTMGALHKGHLSLVEKAGELSDVVIVSIFVNPNQFNDPNDLKNYPRDLENDLRILSTKKVDVVFVPEVDEVYPAPDTRQFDFGQLEKVMEGVIRPGHFNGVAQVVSRLFDIINPDMAFFGQKDFQQLAIIHELVRKLNYNIEIIACPIIREAGGLAMSSRNQLLSSEEKEHAKNISRTLFKAVELKDELSVAKLEKWAEENLNNDPLIDVEYFKVVDTKSLMPVKKWEDPGEKIACVAIKIGRVRLIDNIIFA